jgi:hypothetical protein
MYDLGRGVCLGLHRLELEWQLAKRFLASMHSIMDRDLLD